MNKVLIVAYYWPPGSGAGVQRWLKFAKYLPSTGWEPFILTVDPAYATYPASDNTLLNEVPVGVKVFRTRATDWFRIYRKDKGRIPSAGFASNGGDGFPGRIIRFMRGNFFIPDPRRGWNKYAIREASAIIEAEGIKNIITTSPPHSTQLIGLELKEKYPDINWIADLRDPWTDIYYYGSFYHTPCARRVDAAYERKVLVKADRIITVGKSLKESFCSKVSGIEARTEVITNGWDPADFSELVPSDPGIFTISYIGTLSDAYPLGSFTGAVALLLQKGHRIRLRFVGSVSAGQRELILKSCPGAMPEFLSYVTHGEAIRFMREASLLLLIIPDHFSNRSIVTGKLFEYLASSRPVLCIGPAGGDAADILERSGHGKCAGYNDVAGIISIIESCITGDARSEMDPANEYSRESLTLRLASLLYSLL